VSRWLVHCCVAARCVVLNNRLRVFELTELELSRRNTTGLSLAVVSGGSDSDAYKQHTDSHELSGINRTVA